MQIRQGNIPIFPLSTPGRWGVVSGYEMSLTDFSMSKMDKGSRLPDHTIRTFELKCPCPVQGNPITYTPVSPMPSHRWWGVLKTGQKTGSSNSAMFPRIGGFDR